MEMNAGIDFVITWVDGTDPAWRARKAAHAREDLAAASGEYRYRDWGLLRYWFRCVEKNASWVRKIHLVTCGQTPKWLNLDNPKLNLVNHEDFIPSEYLPTFSIRPIELNLHRIEDLAEQFVFFNDDMFCIAPVQQEDFFRNGLPVDLAALNVHCYTMLDPVMLCVVRDVGLVNKYFTMSKSIAANRRKWLTPKAGAYLARTLVLLKCPRFPGFYVHHCSQPFLKDTYQAIWEAEPALLHDTCMHRFRTSSDVNCWVFKFWQLASGSFVPASAAKYRYMSINSLEAAQDAAALIMTSKTPHVCFNDSDALAHEEFERCAAIIRSSFEACYPEPSSFEIV